MENAEFQLTCICCFIPFEMAGIGAQHKESCDLVYFWCVPNPLLINYNMPVLYLLRILRQAWWRSCALVGTLLFEVFVAFHREGIRAMLMNRCVDGSLSCLAWPAWCKMVQEGMSVCCYTLLTWCYDLHGPSVVWYTIGTPVSMGIQDGIEALHMALREASYSVPMCSTVWSIVLCG